MGGTVSWVTRLNDSYLPGKDSSALSVPVARSEIISNVPVPDEEFVAVSAEDAETVIEAKRIGERIKYLRQRKHMGLVELGRHTGLSASFLSQLETGRVVPTLRNLARIAMVFSRHLSYFFEPESPELFRIIRAVDRQRLPESGTQLAGGSSTEARHVDAASEDAARYVYESLGQVPAPIADPNTPPIAPYVAEFLPTRRSPRSHRHTGREFLYVLSGELEITHDGQLNTLQQGDAVYFDAEVPHSYARAAVTADIPGSDDTPCTALILTLPNPPSRRQAEDTPKRPKEKA